MVSQISPELTSTTWSDATARPTWVPTERTPAQLRSSSAATAGDPVHLGQRGAGRRLEAGRPRCGPARRAAVSPCPSSERPPAAPAGASTPEAGGGSPAGRPTGRAARSSLRRAQPGAPAGPRRRRPVADSRSAQGRGDDQAPRRRRGQREGERQHGRADERTRRAGQQQRADQRQQRDQRGDASAARAGRDRLAHVREPAGPLLPRAVAAAGRQPARRRRPRRR